VITLLDEQLLTKRQQSSELIGRSQTYRFGKGREKGVRPLWNAFERTVTHFLLQG